MLIKKSELKELSDNLRKATYSQNVEFRDNNEGSLSILKNDIHTFASLKNEQLNVALLEHKIMSEYIENISHQLKTPLTSMSIMLDLIEDAPADKQAEFFANIKSSLVQMEWLTTNLLKMAKLDNKTIAFSPKETTLSNLLKTALKPLEILLDVKAQEVELIGDVTLNCDKKWTAEALTNIIKNALEHSPENSTIILACGENPIYSFISVTDCGAGISKDNYKKLFTRFENSHNKSGYGVGLPLALSIIRSQNGDIDVELGGNGKGATFTIKFFKYQSD